MLQLCEHVMISYLLFCVFCFFCFYCWATLLFQLPPSSCFPRLFLVIVARSEGDRRRAGEGEGLLLWEAERHWTHLPGERKQPSFEQNHGHPVCYRGKYRPKCLLTCSNYGTDQEFGGVDWSQAFIKYLEILQEIRRYVYWLLEHLFPTVFRLIPYPLTLLKASHIYVICSRWTFE